MSKVKFTPGPWTVENNEDKSLADILLNIENEDVLVAGIYSGDAIVTEEDKATARLVAAAPEMYELLEAVLEENPPLEMIRQRAFELKKKIDSE